MKLLVAYDGSKFSDNALEDLTKAGLDEEGVEVITMSVAEVWMPPPTSNGNGFDPADFPVFVNEWAARRMKVAKGAIREAETLGKHAKEKVLRLFPKWDVTAFSTYGSPAWEILSKASEFDPDVIVVGTHGRNAVGRVLLGSVSQKILTEAHCTVRIARRAKRDQGLPPRVMIGFDGSKGAEIAVDAVCSRKWKPGTEVRLVAALQSLVPTAIGRFIPPVRDWVDEDFHTEKNLVEKLAERSLSKIRDTGLKTSLEIEDGNPREMLIDHAEKWNAESIFVGAHAFSSKMEKFLIGCTSIAIAERAHCSVEAVRIDED